MVEFINGESKFNANTMNKLQADLISEIYGEDWKKLDLINASKTSTGYGGATGVQYKKIGNHVFVKGSVSLTWDGTNNVVIAVLPVGYRPKKYNMQIKSCSGTRVARVLVKPDGTLNLEWIVNISNGSSYTQLLSWLDVTIDFWTDVE